MASGSITSDIVLKAQHDSSRLMLAQLKTVARGDRLPVSGAKAVLQDRIKNSPSLRIMFLVPSFISTTNNALSQRGGTSSADACVLVIGLYEYQRNNDIQGFNNIRNLITNPDNLPAGPYDLYAPASMQLPYASGRPAEKTFNVFPSPVSVTNSQGKDWYHFKWLQDVSSDKEWLVRLNFKDSPFYKTLESLAPAQECKGKIMPFSPPVMSVIYSEGTTINGLSSVRESTRDQLEFKIKLRPDITEMFSSRNTTREDTKIMVFCAAEPLSPFTKVDIAFPNQIEIKVNGAEVRANFRGLKNRPGSTRPADITDLVRKTSNYENSVAVTYALTNKVPYVWLLSYVAHC